MIAFFAPPLPDGDVERMIDIEVGALLLAEALADLSIIRKAHQQNG